MNKLDEIKKGVDKLEDALLISEPAHFSRDDVIHSSFGAIILGASFALNRLVIDASKVVVRGHIAAIILVTLLLLTAEIYFIGYNRVIKKQERKFGQFWLKRIMTFYCIALLMSLFLVYIFGLNLLIENDPWNIFKLVIMISLPCAMGAAVGDLLKRY